MEYKISHLFSDVCKLNETMKKIGVPNFVFSLFNAKRFNCGIKYRTHVK